MELSHFLEMHERRNFVDKDGWYEPCVNELHKNDGRRSRQTRAPVSDAFVLNAPLGAVPNVPNCMLIENKSFLKTPYRSSVKTNHANVKAALIKDDEIRLYKTNNLKTVPIFQSRVFNDEIIIKTGRQPENRTEFRNALAVMNNKHAKQILTRCMRLPETESKSWFEEMLGLNAWSHEEQKTLSKVLYNKQILRSPLKASQQNETHWHVHSKPVYIHEPRYQNVHADLVFCGSNRNTHAYTNGFYDITGIDYRGQETIATTTTGMALKWKSETQGSPMCIKSLFGASAAARYFSIPLKKYTDNVSHRKINLPLKSAFRQENHTLLCDTTVNGELVSTAGVSIGPYTCTNGGYVYTTDAGLNMGLPHVTNKHRIGDLSNSAKYSGAHHNVFSNSALVTCAGQPLKNVEGKLEFGNGDNGMRLALLSTLDVLEKCHDRNTPPEMLVFEVKDPVNAAQICGSLHAFPINSNGKQNIVGPNSKLKLKENKVFLETKDGQREMELISGIKPIVFENEDDAKTNISSIHKFMKRCLPEKQNRKKLAATFTYRGKCFYNALEPLVFDDDNTLVIPKELCTHDFIPVHFENQTKHLRNTTVDDYRTALLANVAFRSTSDVGNFVLIRPFPVKAEISRLKTTVFESCDLLFEKTNVRK